MQVHEKPYEALVTACLTRRMSERINNNSVRDLTFAHICTHYARKHYSNIIMYFIYEQIIHALNMCPFPPILLFSSMAKYGNTGN